MAASIFTKDSPLVAAVMAKRDLRQLQRTLQLCPRNGADDLCDSDQLIADLLNHCFWASFVPEEGRSGKGSVAICSPDEAPHARGLSGELPVSTQNLVTLMTASPHTPLAVHSRNGELSIWGMADVVPLFCLKFQILRPGTIIASRDDEAIAVFQNGEEHIVSAHLFPNQIVANALGAAHPVDDRLRRATLLLNVVAAMRDQGHGGALVVVPQADDKWKSDVQFLFGFNATASQVIVKRMRELQQAIADKAEADRQQMSGAPAPPPLSLSADKIVDANRGILRERLRSVGELTSIDGVLVMSDQLELLGFGAKLTSQPAEFDVLSLDALTAQKGSLQVTKFRGTRHQSAARFAHEHHDAIVFVASQDGGLTILAWSVEDETVLAVRSLEHLVLE